MQKFHFKFRGSEPEQSKTEFSDKEVLSIFDFPNLPFSLYCHPVNSVLHKVFICYIQNMSKVQNMRKMYFENLICKYIHISNLKIRSWILQVWSHKIIWNLLNYRTKIMASTH